MSSTVRFIGRALVRKVAAKVAIFMPPMRRLIILLSNELCGHTFSFHRRAASMSYIYRH